MPPFSFFLYEQKVQAAHSAQVGDEIRNPGRLDARYEHRKPGLVPRQELRYHVEGTEVSGHKDDAPLALPERLDTLPAMFIEIHQAVELLVVHVSRATQAIVVADDVA